MNSRNAKRQLSRPWARQCIPQRKKVGERGAVYPFVGFYESASLRREGEAREGKMSRLRV